MFMIVGLGHDAFNEEMDRFLDCLVGQLDKTDLSDSMFANSGEYVVFGLRPYRDGCALYFRNIFLERLEPQTS